MQKISFETIKNILLQSKLLLKDYGDSSHNGFPQTHADKIQSGDIFIAFRGSKQDAHDYIPLAIKNGAQCLIIENEDKIPSQNSTPYILVSDARAAWSVLCSEIHSHPEKNLNLYGVTGTDGKTSTVWIASQLVRNNNHKCLSLGTLGAYDGSEHWNLDHTTPDPPVFYSALQHSVRKKIPSVIMEVSSHSLVQGKIQNLHYKGAVFTSFSRDHIDYHETMNEYFAAKCLLFTKHMKADGKIILNYKLSDSFPIKETSYPNMWVYGLGASPNNEKHVPILESKAGKQGQYIKFQIRNTMYEGEIPYFGVHNAENFLAALLIAEDILGFIPSSETWMRLAPIPGRCEAIPSHVPAPRVFVDFAHTPQGLHVILSTLRPYTSAKLWVVFGCGGDRDKGKRPEMAKAAEKLADHLVLTSDNPRTEKPEDILKNMKAGLTANSKAVTIVDREEAIRYAITNAQINDIIVIAGKGHEAFQIIGDKKIPFSDQALAQHYIQALWSKK